MEDILLVGGKGGRDWEGETLEAGAVEWRGEQGCRLSQVLVNTTLTYYYFILLKEFCSFLIVFLLCIINYKIIIVMLL